MTLPGHHAANGQQGRSSKAEFLGSEQGCDDNIVGEF
jgi:hypothetical protein